jgi:hypothetical protein
MSLKLDRPDCFCDEIAFCRYTVLLFLVELYYALSFSKLLLIDDLMPGSLLISLLT